MKVLNAEKLRCALEQEATASVAALNALKLFRAQHDFQDLSQSGGGISCDLREKAESLIRALVVLEHRRKTLGKCIQLAARN